MGKIKAGHIIPFEQRLIETGGNIAHYLGEWGQGYGSDAAFCYVWTSGGIAISRQETFDRWANSRDFILYKPIDKVNLDILRHAVNLAIQGGHCNGAYALEYDLGQYYRKAKKELNK